MIKKIMTNLENEKITLEDIKYIIELNDDNKKHSLKRECEKISKTNFSEIKYETNIYLPTMYQLQDNCLTCGYRTKESKRKYNEKYIYENFKLKLNDIEKFNISGINCYNNIIDNENELIILLNYLKNFDIKINIKINNIPILKIINNYNINSVIYQSSLNRYTNFISKDDKYKEESHEETLKLLKENYNIKTCYEFLIGYGEDYHDIYDKILEIMKIDADIIEVVGLDPFIDSPEEYNPQYTKEYILKIICILRLIFQNKYIKIRYATNNNNYLDTFKKLGVNIISGVYTDSLNFRLKNIDKIQK